MMFHIEAQADEERRQLIRKRLRETNNRLSPVVAGLRGTGADAQVPVEVYAYESEPGPGAGAGVGPGGRGEPVGGLVAYAWWHWLHLDLLWVDERHRGSGLGSRLVTRAEELAREEHGCTHARVATWDFQAPGFYQKAGYTLVSTVEDYPPGCTDHLLTKRL
ncbi:GNAT family N-acetyltransferase [Streptomyces sp. ODS28]|uniref:GNAT family N-acetyltransferase n=1 Tax=Streptomyces sp. ODS28 TaxID=3136688 RepID=UPI0031EE9E08